MNFLLGTASRHVNAEPPPVVEPPIDKQQTLKPTTSLEGLIAEETFAQYSRAGTRDGDKDSAEVDNSGFGGEASKVDTPIAERFSTVSEEEGSITIPYRYIPDNMAEVPDILSLNSLDRSFVFPGEKVHILVCLSACKQDTEVITPFKVAAVMSKNGIKKVLDKQNEERVSDTTVYGENELSPDGQPIARSGENLEKEDFDPPKDVTEGESLLRMEDHKRQTAMLLQRVKNSHFFARIAEAGEPLWSKRSDPKINPESSEPDHNTSVPHGTKKSGKGHPCLNTIIDKGDFDANVAGGAARNAANCFALPNGDIVVVLQVNVVVDSLKDPVIEILQFEKHQDSNLSPENENNSYQADHDPCGELLKWLLPLDYSSPTSARSLSPQLSAGSGIPNASHRSAHSASSGSQLFSFGHFRSYSMSSLPQNTPPPSGPVKAQSAKPTFDLEEWDQYSSHRLLKGQKYGTEELLSFRGVSLERERFSVRCGLEGIYIPGRRWQRKLEIIQPVEIKSFAADCNTDDLLCVQIKNVSPAHTPDIIIYIDALTIVFEEAGRDGPSSSLPIACIEAGNDHSLPNLALRKGEEHSFILKPMSSMGKSQKALSERSVRSLGLRLPSKIIEGKGIAATVDQYAIIVSCRCNYTESRLFFKQPTSWRPRVSRDLMISVASEISGESPGSHGRVTQLPVQVLTLQASNMTSEDLTLTVLAPASFTSPPSVVSLNSTPSSPLSPFLGFSEFTERVNNEKRSTAAMHRNGPVSLASESHKDRGDGGILLSSLNEASPVSDVIPNSGLACTHLWLQSRVPLGRVPSQSTSTIKLELLPLTDGIITLDTLQIDVKEKGLTYIPEHSLKINATSSISTGIV